MGYRQLLARSPARSAAAHHCSARPSAASLTPRRFRLPGKLGLGHRRLVDVWGLGRPSEGEEGESVLGSGDVRAFRVSLERRLADSVAGDDEEVLSEEGLCVWCSESALLPGFREVLAVREARLLRMFEQLLRRTGTSPLRYVHFSSSSALSARSGLAMEALYGKSPGPPTPSAIIPDKDPRREAIGTMMEVCLAERSPDGRLLLAVRALGVVRLVRLTQRTPFLRALVEWRPDEEETEAAGGAGPAVVAGEVWADRFEAPLQAEAELAGCRPLTEHVVEVARRFHELAAPGSGCVGGAGAVAAEVSEAAHWVSTPASRSLAAAAGPELDAAAEAACAPLWDAMRRIEELQELIGARGSTSYSPSMARAMRPVLTPPIAEALQPLLDDAEGGRYAGWPGLRRARWLSFALAAALPEVARGPGRQALLEAPSVAARLALLQEVLSTRQQQLAAFLTMLEATPEEEEEGEWGGEGAEEAVKGEAGRRGGPTLQQAARLERLMGSGAPGVRRLDDTNDAARAKAAEGRRARKRWLQQQALREAAECTLQHGGDMGACEEEWRAVRDLSEMPSQEDDEGEEGGRRQ